jgi:hypothetical protein
MEKTLSASVCIVVIIVIFYYYSMVPGSFPEVKRPGREFNYSPPYCVEVKNEWNYYLYSLCMSSWREQETLCFIIIIIIIIILGTILLMPRNFRTDGYDKQSISVPLDAAYLPRRGYHHHHHHHHHHSCTSNGRLVIRRKVKCIHICSQNTWM